MANATLVPWRRTVYLMELLVLTAEVCKMMTTPPNARQRTSITAFIWLSCTVREEGTLVSSLNAM
jgi:hypothetical protein